MNLVSTTAPGGLTWLVNMRSWISLGAFLGGLGVIMGAFGAHSLKDHLTEQKLAAFHTATQYLVTHSLALILVGVLVSQMEHENPLVRKLNRVGMFFTAGIILFSGSLYILTFGGSKFFGPITPIGGLTFVIGWFTFAFIYLKKDN